MSGYPSRDDVETGKVADGTRTCGRVSDEPEREFRDLARRRRRRRMSGVMRLIRTRCPEGVTMGGDDDVEPANPPPPPQPPPAAESER